MNGALEWIGKIAEWLGRFIPAWILMDSTQGAVKFQTVRVRDLCAGRWTMGARSIALGPGLHFYWPAVSQIKQWTVARQSINLATQTITTSDDKTVAVGGILIFRIVDVLEIVANTWHPDDAIRGVAAGVVHDVCSAGSWHALKAAKCSGALKRDMLEALRDRLRPFGVVPIDAPLTDFALTRVLKVMQTTSSDT